MVIRVGDNPEGTPNINKFIDRKAGEGLRGQLIAIHRSGKLAIVLAMNSTFDGRSVQEGKLYLIEEKNPNEYPLVKKQVSDVPTTKDWKIVEQTS